EKDVECFVHPHGNPGRRAAHRLQSRERNEVAQRCRHAEDDPSGGIIRERFTDGAGFAQERQPARGQNRARFRDRDAGSTSNHQLLPEVLFELRQGSAESRLRQAELLRRAIDAAQLGHPQKVFNLIEVHGRPVQRFPLNTSTPQTLTLASTEPLGLRIWSWCRSPSPIGLARAAADAILTHSSTVLFVSNLPNDPGSIVPPLVQRANAMTLARRRFLQLIAGAAALPVRIAKAQSYPARPVRIIIGFAAGASG